MELNPVKTKELGKLGKGIMLASDKAQHQPTGSAWAEKLSGHHFHTSHVTLARGLQSCPEYPYRPATKCVGGEIYW